MSKYKKEQEVYEMLDRFWHEIIRARKELGEKEHPESEELFELSMSVNHVRCCFHKYLPDKK